MQEITARKQAQEQARLAAERLEQVIEGTGDAIVVTDLERRVLTWNRGAERMFGWRREEVIGKKNPTVPPDRLEESRARRQRILETGQPSASYETERVGKDGRRIPVLGTLSPMRDERGRIVGLVGITKDVSLSRRLEEQAKALARLEERERIAMDLHDGVIQSLYGVALGLGARARALKQARRNLHPHSAGLPDRVELLEQSSDELLATLVEALARIDDVITEIRAYIVGLHLPDGQPGDLRTGLRSLVERLRAHGGIEPSLELPAEQGALLNAVESSHVLYVAREAVSNVLRHARASAVEIQLVGEEGVLRLTIRDNGRGFHPGRTGRRRGDGLRNMAERARAVGADLAIISQPGRGTEVRLELPLALREP